MRQWEVCGNGSTIPVGPRVRIISLVSTVGEERGGVGKNVQLQSLAGNFSQEDRSIRTTALAR